MGDFTALERKLRLIERDLSGQGVRDITEAVARAAKKDGMAELVRDLGGDRKFTNWRPKLSVGYELTSDHSAELKGRPSGPWKVLERGRSPGRKYSKKARRVVGWGATTGHGTWERTHRIVARETPGRVDREVQRALRKALG